MVGSLSCWGQVERLGPWNLLSIHQGEELKAVDSCYLCGDVSSGTVDKIILLEQNTIVIFCTLVVEGKIHSIH